MSRDDERPAYMSDVNSVEDALEAHAEHLISDASFESWVRSEFAKSEARAKFWRAVAIPSISGVFLLLAGFVARGVLGG